jgi:uncharacterized membrane protein YhhN
MLIRWAMQPDRPPAPKVITETVLSKVGFDPERQPAPLREATWAAAHLAFGGLLALSCRPQRPLMFGAGIWLLNYGLALPALGLYPRPNDDHIVRGLETLLSHVVYGAALHRLSAV